MGIGGGANGGRDIFEGGRPGVESSSQVVSFIGEYFCDCRLSERLCDAEAGADRAGVVDGVGTVEGVVVLAACSGASSVVCWIFSIFGCCFDSSALTGIPSFFAFSRSKTKQAAKCSISFLLTLPLLSSAASNLPTHSSILLSSSASDSSCLSKLS